MVAGSIPATCSKRPFGLFLWRQSRRLRLAKHSACDPATHCGWRPSLRVRQRSQVCFLVQKTYRITNNNLSNVDAQNIFLTKFAKIKKRCLKHTPNLFIYSSISKGLLLQLMRQKARHQSIRKFCLLN